MNLSTLPPSVSASHVSLENLAGNTQLPEREKIAEVSRQFEAVLLRQILGEAQKTIFPSKMNPESFSSGIYRDLVTQQLADGISQSGSFGVAKSLTAQLGHQLGVQSVERPHETL